MSNGDMVQGATAQPRCYEKTPWHRNVKRGRESLLFTFWHPCSGRDQEIFPLRGREFQLHAKRDPWSLCFRGYDFAESLLVAPARLNRRAGNRPAKGTDLQECAKNARARLAWRRCHEKNARARCPGGKNAPSRQGRGEISLGCKVFVPQLQCLKSLKSNARRASRPALSEPQSLKSLNPQILFSHSCGSLGSHSWGISGD